MIQPRSQPRRTVDRRGVALLVAIVCVSVAAAVMYGIAQLALQAYREADLEERRVQAGWIMESGIDRAAAQLVNNGDYTGERWILTPEELGRRYGAQVQIEVTRIPAEPEWRQVRVVADYPAELPLRVRESRTLRVHMRP